MKFKNVIQLALLATVIMFTAPSCVKEGPMGATGETGKDVNETCKMCHNPASVDKIATQFEFSKHSYGEAAFEESGQLACTPCHAQEAFKYVVTNNISSAFIPDPDPTKAGKFLNGYATIPSAAYGEIGCATCHSKLHTAYDASDLALTTVAPVSMTMWGGAADKTIDLPADDHKSNLCVKCHQPRPFVNALTTKVLDYVAMAADPAGIVYDGTAEKVNTTDKIRPGYRTHTHYGTAGAIYAGKGGVEFAGAGPLAPKYENSAHTTVASCIDCHMGAAAGKSEMVGRAGGHSFVAKGNLTTCNTSGCHTSDPNTTPGLWTAPRKEIQDLLNALAAKLVEVGDVDGVPTTIDILNRNPDTESNLWAGLTTNKYDGYLNVYDPITNPNVRTNNTNSFQYVLVEGAKFPATWTQEMKDYNAKLPQLKLTNAQMGALINFQLCLRDYSLGIHNLKYTRALLTNSIAVLN